MRIKIGVLLGLLLIGLVVVTKEPGAEAQTVDVAAAAQREQIIALESKTLLQQFKDAKIFQSIKEMQEKLQEAREKYEWVEKLKTIKRVNALLESSVCNTQQLELAISLADQYDCVTKINYDLAIMNLDASVDILYLIVVAGLSMDQGQRIQSLNDVLSLLEKAQRDIMRLNKTIRLSVMQAMTEEYLNKQYTGGFIVGRY